MDELDLASDREQLARDKAVAEIQAGVKPIPTSKVCLQCGEPTKDGARWCCPTCRDDYQRWDPTA